MSTTKVKRRVGKYELGRTIGEGTFAKVRFAKDTEGVIHTVAPHALARQRLSVAPCGLARPNGLCPANKNQYGLNLKYY